MENIFEKIKMLTERLNECRINYYNLGTSILDDREYDRMLEELAQYEKIVGKASSDSPTQVVGAPILSELKKVHIINKAMLSLQKVHSAKEICDFAQNEKLIATTKCDGLSLRLVYENRKLVSANTRGDGTIGGDVTAHAFRINGVLQELPEYASPARTIVDGEAIIYYDDFDAVNSLNQFKNPRNTVAGALSLLTTTIVSERRVSFIAWDLIKPIPASYSEGLETLKNLGFTTPYTEEVSSCDIATIDATINNIFSKSKNIPCDGVVFRIDNTKSGDERGSTAKAFLNAVAFKAKDEVVKTTLLNIEWSLGRTGKITPVAIFKPVDLEGSVVSRASLHNFDIMKELYDGTWYCGLNLEIFKANLIIPQIKKVWDSDTKEKDLEMFSLEYPKVCPECGKPLDYDTCVNPDCPSKLVNKLAHYCSKQGMDIKGLSKITLQKFIDAGYLNELSDLYRLKEYENELCRMSGFGSASIGKILKAIDDSTKDVELYKFIAALGIPLIGPAMAKLLAKAARTYEDFLTIALADATGFRHINGFGHEMEYSVAMFDYTQANKIAKLLTFKTEKETTQIDGTLNNVIFCVTGSLSVFKNRSQLKEDIESKGGKVVDSISSKVNYLINNDINSDSAKNRKAKQLSIPIITEEEYLNGKY